MIYLFVCLLMKVGLRGYLRGCCGVGDCKGDGDDGDLDLCLVV